MKLLRVIGLFFQTLFTIVGNLLMASDLYVDGVVWEKRLKICQECPQYRRDLDMCQECFCQMRVKSRLNGSACPLHKW